MGGWFLFDRSSEEKVVTDANNQKNTNKTTQTNTQREDAPNLVLGQTSAPITIVEYADFKCPTCNKYTREIYPELKQKYLDTGKAKIIFRNLPFIAEDSRTAAEGAYCSNDQNKFADYHTLLFEHIWNEYYSQGKISEGESNAVFSEKALSNLVSSIGIDSDEFSGCLDSGKYKDAVSSDLDMSRNDGAVGTPTFFIGGQKIVGAQPFGIFDKLIQATQ